MKKAFSLILALLLAFVFSMSTLAVSPPLVADEGKTLSEEDVVLLTEILDSLSEEYDIHIVYATTESLFSYDAQDSADTYFDYKGYGVGADRDGIIFYICTGTRDFHFSTSGECIAIFSDSDIDYLTDEALPYLKAGDYAGAVEAYAYACRDVLNAYATGEYSPEYSEYYEEVVVGGLSERDRSEEKTPSDIAATYILALIIALVIALVLTRSKSRQMKTAVKNNSANSYMKQGSVNITNSQDIFLYSNVYKTAIPKDTSTSSGSRSGSSSSTHTASSGRTHGGGGGKF